VQIKLNPNELQERKKRKNKGGEKQVNKIKNEKVKLQKKLNKTKQTIT